jgi:hypothetical protein
MTVLARGNALNGLDGQRLLTARNISLMNDSAKPAADTTAIIARPRRLWSISCLPSAIAWLSRLRH